MLEKLVGIHAEDDALTRAKVAHAFSACYNGAEVLDLTPAKPARQDDPQDLERKEREEKECQERIRKTLEDPQSHRLVLVPSPELYSNQIINDLGRHDTIKHVVRRGDYEEACRLLQGTFRFIFMDLNLRENNDGVKLISKTLKQYTQAGVLPPDLYIISARPTGEQRDLIRPYQLNGAIKGHYTKEHLDLPEILSKIERMAQAHYMRAQRDLKPKSNALKVEL